ncbi:hypothetical protein BDZ45DRAFT_805944 [Acephala macrosclerotiorum]|nr:hypothetical protein BDZ45DRAFT_805944 [Acephala macrosclerotiorum]
MEAITRDSFYFLEPEQREGHPQTALPSSKSRVVDITAFSTQNPLKYHVKSHPRNVTDAAELKRIVHRPLVDDANSLQHVDRVYYEINWPFARSLLCRRFVKGVFDDWDSKKTELQEEFNLIDFQMFLFNADDRDELDRRPELDFSFFGPGSTSDGALLGAKDPDRILYHFGLDWMAIVPSSIGQNEEVFKRLRLGNKEILSNKCIVRRRTCIASIIQTQDTPKLLGSSLCPISWESKAKLVHRRTLILFNELHASQDGLNFKDWISPEKTNIWEVVDDFNLSKDNEVTTVAFIHRLTGTVWQEVVHAWRNVIDKASEHIRTSEKLALDKGLSIEQLETLAQDTWEDSLSWFTIHKLLIAHQKMISKSQSDLKALAKLVGLTEEKNQLQTCLDELKELETIVSQDFSTRGQSISSLVYNIIGVRNAQAAQTYSESMGRITWISFIFFPLIAVSGLFGMNIDLLANNPSVKWYFIVAVPFLVLVLGLALILNYAAPIRAKMRSKKD